MLANRLRRDLERSSDEVNEMRKELKRLESELRQSRSAAILDKKDNKNLPVYLFLLSIEKYSIVLFFSLIIYTIDKSWTN